MDNTINHELDEITFENSVSSLENLDKQITNNEDMLIFQQLDITADQFSSVENSNEKLSQGSASTLGRNQNVSESLEFVENESFEQTTPKKAP